MSDDYGSPEWQERALGQWEEDRARQRATGDRYGNAVGSTAWNRKRNGMLLVALGTAGLPWALLDPVRFWLLGVVSVAALALGLRIWRKARRDFGGPWFE